MWLVDLNYSFECDWLIELCDNTLSNNKLYNDNLASELVKNRSFLKPITSEEIVILIISNEMNNYRADGQRYNCLDLTILDVWWPLFIFWWIIFSTDLKPLAKKNKEIHRLEF